MPKARYLPFAESPKLAPEFTGRPTQRLPYRTVRFLGGAVLLNNPKDSDLSVLDFDLMTRAAFGQTNPMISDEVFYAPRTVENKILKLQQEKLGVTKRSMILPAAFRLGYMSMAEIGEAPFALKQYGPKERFPVNAYSLGIISGIGMGLSMAQIGEGLGKTESAVKSQLIYVGDQVHFRGAEAFLAAAVVTGQVDPYVGELTTETALAA